MAGKLTLRLDEELIRQAKAYADSQGKSVSQLVSDYFAALDDGSGMRKDEELPPLTRSFVGCMEGSGVDIADYYRHLEEKHL